MEVKQMESEMAGQRCRQSSEEESWQETPHQRSRRCGYTMAWTNSSWLFPTFSASIEMFGCMMRPKNHVPIEFGFQSIGCFFCRLKRQWRLARFAYFFLEKEIPNLLE
jgi:hypothetical protein